MISTTRFSKSRYFWSSFAVSSLISLFESLRCAAAGVLAVAGGGTPGLAAAFSSGLLPSAGLFSAAGWEPGPSTPIAFAPGVAIPAYLSLLRSTPSVEIGCGWRSWARSLSPPIMFPCRAEISLHARKTSQAAEQVEMQGSFAVGVQSYWSEAKVLRQDPGAKTSDSLVPTTHIFRGAIMEGR